MTAPAIHARGATTALTRRTNLRKAFLAPWHPEVRQCWLYSLAHAQWHTGVAVHMATLCGNHHHVDVTPSLPNLPRFTRLLNGETSCSVQALLARELYDTPRDLWDGRSTHAMRLLDAGTQANHLIYEYVNPSAAGMVDRPEHMPGQVIDFGHWKTGGIWVPRPSVYFSQDRPERLFLELSPPPLLYEAFDGDLDALVHHMKRLAEGSLRALRRARTRPVLGAQLAPTAEHHRAHRHGR